MKIIFGKLYGKSEKGFCLFEIRITRYTYMADFDFLNWKIVFCNIQFDLGNSKWSKQLKKDS